MRFLLYLFLITMMVLPLGVLVGYSYSVNIQKVQSDYYPMESVACN